MYHLLFSALAATAFAWKFTGRWIAVPAHVLVVAEWDALMLVALGLLVAFVPARRSAWTRLACRVVPGIALVVQLFLYALNAVSNSFWGHNITGQLVASFIPTIWSGKEQLPAGTVGIACFTLALTAAVAFASRWWGPQLHAALRARVAHRRRAMVGALLVVAAAFSATMAWGVRSDKPLWTTELVASFFRPYPFAFEPTARREAEGDRDDAIRAAYPKTVPAARRKNVLLIIVDSLRADHMGVYGYGRPTTPFLSGLVADGRMKEVADAFSSCSESFCGITSTLASRDFRDITVRDFQIQDVLKSQGYQTWFLLSGNHSAWNGLPQFYRASPGTYFDGSSTRRYSMDDDRGVLEAMEHVPPASPGQPAFFYVHLMSTHYLGVQFPESHFYTSANDQVTPGLNAYSILPLLNKPDRYDDKIRQADDIIRQVFDGLSAKHYLDDAVVVVTADHGEGLGERHWAHGWNLYNEDIRIPLLLYDTTVTTETAAATYGNLAFASQVDVAPTILDRLGLPIPASWEGRSLVSPDIKPLSFHQTYFLPNRFAIINRTDTSLFKYISTPQYGKEELFDLRGDPGELHDLATGEPALTALLRDKLRTYLAAGP